MGFQTRRRLRTKAKTEISRTAAKLIEEFGLDASLITPTGKNGIIKKDVIDYLAANPVPEPEANQDNPPSSEEE